SIVHNRSHRWRSTPFQLAPWQALLAATILLPVAILFEGPPNVAWDATSVVMLLYAGIPGTALAYWAAAVSSSELPASPTSLGLLATPAISILVALFLLGEQPTLILIVALALIRRHIRAGSERTAPDRATRAMLKIVRRLDPDDPDPCNDLPEKPKGM